jgi:DnaK suppressor protein
MLSKDKIEKFQKRLLEMRASILNRTLKKSGQDLALNSEDLVDETDHAAAMIQQNMAINVQEMERSQLREIDHALAKIENGTYGICEDTEEPIEEARLDAQPFTRYSVEAAELREQKAKRYAHG